LINGRRNFGAFHFPLPRDKQAGIKKRVNKMRLNNNGSLTAANRRTIII